MKTCALVAVASLFHVSLALAQSPRPVGAQFLVNTYTSNHQWIQSVAVDADGDFVVVWQSLGSDNGDPEGYSVQGQRYTSDGVPAGGQFLVNTYTTHDQRSPAVAVDANGDFVVVWSSGDFLLQGPDGSGDSIRAQRYASDGSLRGAELAVNTYTTGDQRRPSVAMAADGHFIVAWDSNGSDNGDTSSFSVQGQRFASDGAPAGGQFLVNAYTPSIQRHPAVAVDADGDFVVVWQSLGSDNGDPSGHSVQGQRFASDGAPAGGQFLVNTYTTDDQWRPAVAMTPAGVFVVVWVSLGSDNGDPSGQSIQGQRFASDGAPTGGQFLVNTYTTDDQFYPAVALAPAGDFVVVWSSYGSDNGDPVLWSVQGQRFASDGAPTGGQFRVNTYTLSYEWRPAVAVDANGSPVVVWDSSNSDNGDPSGPSVQGQRFTVAIFIDGFESGDTSAWSRTIGG